MDNLQNHKRMLCISLASALLILMQGLNAKSVQADVLSADRMFDSVSVYAGQGADHNLRELPGRIAAGQLDWDKTYGAVLDNT